MREAIGVNLRVRLGAGGREARRIGRVNRVLWTSQRVRSPGSVVSVGCAELP